MPAAVKLADIAPRTSSAEAPEYQQLDIYSSYKQSPYLSVKHSSYFQTYEHLLAPYRGKAFTFVEIGVANGGSLFMWRDYFGPQARIIGVEFNPEAKRWEQEGFEIFIGSQSDPAFWESFFAKVGDVDVILDDGGHTNQQQIITTHCCIPHIKDGGLLIIEDTHTSYFKAFGNPSRYSFMNFAKNMVNRINARFPDVAKLHTPERAVFSVGFYESIVSFHIDRRKCFSSTPTSNEGKTFHAKDFRRHGTPRLIRVAARIASRMGFDPFNLRRYF